MDLRHYFLVLAVATGRQYADVPPQSGIKSISGSEHSVTMNVNLTVEEDLVSYRLLALFKAYT